MRIMNLIQAYLSEKNMKQSTFVASSGIPQSTVSEVLRGERNIGKVTAGRLRKLDPEFFTLERLWGGGGNE